MHAFCSAHPGNGMPINSVEQMELRHHTSVTSDASAGALNRDHVRRRFERTASSFGNADFVHRHAAAELFERLSPVVLEARRILDLGSAAGAASRMLARTHKRSRVLSVDLSLGMLRKAKSSRSRFARISELQADAARLPLAAGCIDLVFANMLLPWSDDNPGLFREIGRVLRKEGLFAFSALGPSSLRELREAWRAVDDDEHVNRFLDMHDLGDQLVRAGLRDPVLDVDRLNVAWRSSADLFRDLTAAGARNSLERRRRTLTGKRRFAAMRERLERALAGGSMPLGLELVFGHAWGGGAPLPAGEYRLDVGDIGRRRR
jgi:malonyl-CoA O-methyltransferase